MMLHTVWQWLLVFFSWPSGSIWSNVVANPIIIGLAALWSARKVIRHHEKLHDEHMAKLDEIHEHVKSNSNSTSTLPPS